MKNSMKVVISLFCLLGINSALNSQTITDVDGNVYNTVTIGTQVWMKENLKTTKYNDGTVIPNITNDIAWSNLTTSGYCWYNNNISFKDPYGAHYNWYTVNTEKLCPTGWHVPTEPEFTILRDYLGTETRAGEKMKEEGFVHWDQCQDYKGATNESGFTAIAAGLRWHYGIFEEMRENSYFWCTTEHSTDDAYYYELHCNSNYCYSSFFNGKSKGLSVRCLRDKATSSVEFGKSKDQAIFPNPATNTISLSGLNAGTSISIYNMQGKLELSSDKVSSEVDISMLPKGIYMVILNSEITTCTKLVKE